MNFEIPQPNKEEDKNFKPEPAESFAIEYMNTAEGVTGMMRKLGFIEQGASAPDENTVIAKGRKSDGTTIELTIKKGDNYISPKEFAEKYKDI